MAEPPTGSDIVAETSTEQSVLPNSDQPLDSIEEDTKVDESNDAKDGEVVDGEGGVKADAEDTTAGVQQQYTENNITEDQWKSMMDVVMAIYDYREEDGHDPSRLFHRSVNKRYVPDYYDVIKEPVALSILKQRINKREYKSYAQFVRDCALIPHNAQTYNRPKSQAYEDAIIIKEVFISEFKKLVEEGLITAEEAELPDLGEIPEADPVAEEEEEEEEDEEDEEDDSDEDAPRRRRRRGRPSLSAKREGKEDGQQETRKKRGRPPRVDTPMEARIKAVLKGIRKLKDPNGELKVRHFERLPDKGLYPDYFMEIREPMAIDLIKRKSKRKKYQSVDHFMRDMDLMFENAKSYNQPDSQIYQDAVDLQREAYKLADKEKRKPDTEYLMEDGRLPLPNGILHKNELYKVGDWVHIQNPNDVTKPIVAQIYRTWQDSEGEKWINACWYYRPEQTVHHFEKHFYPNEVVKTGQYRDHRVDEIVDRCFVMFFTRFSRGRPRGLPPDKEVYVCEARYNEEKHKLNKIKTWASCLPDEVRERDYEMDLFDIPRKIRKLPSPIKHLLKEDAKETDDLPKPTWGAENAPPIVGAVHRRPRDENESPPPEPTPSPPPQAVPQPSAHPLGHDRQPSVSSRPPTRQSVDGQGDTLMSGITDSPSIPRHSGTSAAPTPSLPAATAASQAYQLPQSPMAGPYQSPLSTRPNAYTPQTSHLPSHQASLTTPQYSAQQSVAHSSYSANRLQAAPPTVYNPNAPRPVEVFHLGDAANSAIPATVREQFQRDEYGRVLFFSSPPLDMVPPASKRVCHSLKYLAAREERRKLIVERKRKAAAVREQREEEARRRRAEENIVLASKVEDLTEKALSLLSTQISASTDEFYRHLYKGKADMVKQADQARLRRVPGP